MEGTDQSTDDLVGVSIYIALSHSNLYRPIRSFPYKHLLIITEKIPTDTRTGSDWICGRLEVPRN